MTDLAGVKVGDKLYVAARFGPGTIVDVDRITPTGRVITRMGEFNPNGRMRGAQGWDQNYARPATEDDIAGVYRARLVGKIERFRGWDKLSAEDLKTVADIVARQTDSRSV